MRIDDVSIVMRNINEIIPYWRNPRRNDKTVEALIPVIEKNGFNVPIVIDKNNVVVKGHARLKAARRLGMKEVPCIVSNAPEEVIKADRIADNKIQELSSWDFERRDFELKRIGDSLTFGKLFYPEESEVGNQAFDVPDFEYKPTGLDFSGADYDEDAPSAHHEHPPVEMWAEVPEGKEYVPPIVDGSPTFDKDEHPNAKRKFRTLCPYCGKITEVIL